MEISVRQTNIKPKFLRCLLVNGIVLVSHLSRFDALRLAQKTRLSLDDCEKILTCIKPKRPHYVIKASELMVKPFERISTLIKGLDEVLGGGIRCGHITEISGEAGAGKSNLCSAIGTLVMLPKKDGGLDGDVLMIHTEGGGKLKLAIKRFNTLAASVDYEDLIHNKLHVMNCCKEQELVEMINRLPAILDEKSTVKLVIIDSIAAAFKDEDTNSGFQYYDRRALTLTKIAKLLAQLAWDRRLAILATNHVRYDFKSGENRPTLGKTWSNICQTKIYLERNSHRFAHVTKGALNVPVPINFTITNDLFED